MARVPFDCGANRQKTMTRAKSVTDGTASTSINALDRVPSRATWPPPWLAKLAAEPVEQFPAASDGAEPKAPAVAVEQPADVQRAEPAVVHWSPELFPLIAWFIGSRDRLPQEPFLLRPGCGVVRPHRFYQALDRDIVAGPEGARARYGLLNDLTDLRNLLEGSAEQMTSSQVRQPAHSCSGSGSARTA
jgi:hypothetical protein